MTSRWSDYFLTKKFTEFWQERLQEPGATVCVVLGLGFDPRSLLALRCLSGSGWVWPSERPSCSNCNRLIRIQTPAENLCRLSRRIHANWI